MDNNLSAQSYTGISKVLFSKKDRWQCLDNRGEKSSRGVAMVAKFLDLNKPWSCKYRIKKRKT